MSGQSYHSFQASHPETKDRIIKAGLLASRISADSSKQKLFRRRYLNQIRGLIYEGKKSPTETKRYKPKYIDLYQVKEGDNFQYYIESNESYLVDTLWMSYQIFDDVYQTNLLTFQSYMLIFNASGPVYIL